MKRLKWICVLVFFLFGHLCIAQNDLTDHSQIELHDLTVITDLDTAREQARQKDKPLLILFAGYACLADTDEPWLILIEDNVRKMILEHFILVALYVDDKRELPVEQQYEVDNYGQTITTIGRKNLKVQQDHFNSNAQPLYALVYHTMKLLTEPKLRTTSKEIEEFMVFLAKGLENYRR